MFKTKKIKLPIKMNEIQIVLNALNEFRNIVIQQGRCTEPIDELLLKIIKPINRIIKKESIIELRDYFRTESIFIYSLTYITFIAIFFINMWTNKYFT